MVCPWTSRERGASSCRDAKLVFSLASQTRDDAFDRVGIVG